MDDESDEDFPRLKRLPSVALLATAAMAAAILYNTVVHGGGRAPSRLETLTAEDAAQAGSTKRLVDAGDGNASVVTLHYDPVVEAVQRELASSGYYDGPVDGVYGKRTRKAISAYQAQNAMDETGKATPALIEHIKFTREVAEASKFTGSVEAAPPEDAAPAESVADDPDRIRQLQVGLAELGYSPGPADGSLSAQTAKAIRQFESDRGLADTGSANAEVMMELAKISGDSELPAQ